VVARAHRGKKLLFERLAVAGAHANNLTCGIGNFITVELWRIGRIGRLRIVRLRIVRFAVEAARICEPQRVVERIAVTIQALAPKR
jgi:hypothetical protein